jgi:menaquinone-dependent protoporphyrinogen oxidase
VTVAKGDEPLANAELEQYQGFLVAGSIISGRHQRYIENFVRRNLSRLNAVPGAFVSVSGTAASPFPDKRAEAERLVQKFLTATGWRPTTTATFGGAIAYREYGFVTRWIMLQISKRNKGPTDTSRNHELTDWDAVDRFADTLAAVFQSAEAPAAGAPAG